jgi:transcriptional regulator with XRE-family HTH domain
MTSLSSLRDYRKQKKITIGQAAGMADLSTTTIRKIENDNPGIRWRSVLKYAAALGIENRFLLP